MFNSLKTVAEIMQTTPKISEWLLDADKYLAHTRQGHRSEKLEEHVDLVNSYFKQLCVAHGLDSVIDRLIIDIVKVNFSQESQLYIAEYIKKLFINAIHFHDFGKVNENFQAEPKKMNNPFFKIIPNHPIGSTHSALGAYLFILKHMQDTAYLKLQVEDLMKLHLLIILLSYPIFRHHAPILSEPVNGDIHLGEEIKVMKNYIALYQFQIHPALAEKAPLNWQKQFFEKFNKILKAQFPLFALLKLNFSLLTASDYLATHEYMSDAPTTDFGVFNGRERTEEITNHLQAYKHNKDTFANIENFTFTCPLEKSNENLNLIRKEIAVELIQTLRQYLHKRLFYIEAPTGSGKTNLSMIALAELLKSNVELNKVFYVFPFTTLITQTFGALQETLGLRPDELVQLHSKAGFQSKGEAIEDGLYGKEKKDYIDNHFALYPVTVLSHVKFFDVLKTNYKETNYLLHRLANSVVIIDELQTYNPTIWDKMLYFISQYAEYFNIRFILMSATLPKISELNIGQPDKPHFTDLLPNARQYLQNPDFASRVNFRFDLFDEEITLEDLAHTVIEKSTLYAANSKNRSVYTIVEFIYKKSATAFHQEISKQEHVFDKIFVLSGTILEPRRRQIINFLKNEENRHLNILLITTQVVEAGVDIDMDLGFKNISLIDSDEQLAGRVNRNASKDDCEVYLFRLDDARVLYAKDIRYQVTRDKKLISREDYQRILQQKDFDYLYNKVFARIDAYNSLNYADNFKHEISNYVEVLNYKKISENFKIIDQQNESVFVPVDVPIEVESSESGKMEKLFSDDDLLLLENLGFYRKGERELSGKSVWQAYEYLIHNRSKGFNIKEKVDFKLLQSIMSKFTFSLVSFSKDYKNIMEGFGEERFGYMYFSHWNDDIMEGKPYDYESGLNSKAFSDAAFI